MPLYIILYVHLLHSSPLQRFSCLCLEVWKRDVWHWHAEGGNQLARFFRWFAATQFSAFIVTFVAKAAISELLRSAPWQGSQLQFLGVSKVTLMDFIPWATRVRESQREQVRSQHGFGKDRRRFFCALHLILKCKIIPRPYRKQENWTSLPVVLGKTMEKVAISLGVAEPRAAWYLARAHWWCYPDCPGGSWVFPAGLPRTFERKHDTPVGFEVAGLGSFSPLWKEK